jgi:multidrug efflux pump subunit AcrB
MIPRLPVKLNPSRRLPVVHVSFSFGGQSARAVETEVTSKLEGMLSRIRGIREISSYSSNGWGSVTLRLSEDVNPDKARFEVSSVIRQARSSLPEGVSYPHISMSGTEEEVNQPFLRYTVNAPFSPIHILEYINDNLKPKIAEIKGIDNVDVTGATRMIYRLEYDYELLQNFHVSAADIRAAIQACMSREFLGIGKIQDENQNEQWIRIMLSPLQNGEGPGVRFDPSLIQVRSSDGTILYLDQLVKTAYEEEEATSYFRINGLNSIYISITAEDAANQLALSRQVQGLVENYRHTLPKAYELHLTYDAGEYIQTEMNKIYFRSGLTILILLCFIFLTYRKLKYSLLILFSLVSTLFIAALFFFLFKIEMQVFSLAGLTISLSLIIDNAIVMSDQIIRRGNKKAFLAILTATLTSVGALSIILFMDENVRNNLRDFTGVIIISLSVSLLVARFMIPAMIEKMHLSSNPLYTRRVGRKVRQTRISRLAIIRKMRGKRKLVYFDRIYGQMIFFMQRRKGWFIALVILAFGIPVFLLPEKIEPETRKGYFVNQTADDLDYWSKLYNQTFGSTFYREHLKPVIDRALGGSMRLFAHKVGNGSYSGDRSETTLNIAATLPNGATRDQMNFLIQKMEDYIRQYPEVKQFETYIESGRRASIRILFLKQHQRSSFPHLLKSKLIGKALDLGGGSWSVYGLGDGFSNEMKERAGSSRIKLLGYNYDELNALAREMQDSLLKHRRIKEVLIDSKFSWYKNDYMEYAFDLHKEELVETAILPVDLFNATRPMFEKNIHAGDWLHDGHIEPVRLFSRQAGEIDIWNMEHYPGQSGDRKYKLTDIAQIEKRIEPQDIAKENQQYRLCLQYEYIGAYQQSQKVMEQVIDNFNKTAPLGYKAESESYHYWWGKSGNASQYLLLFLVIVIIFFMTGFLFNSSTQPLVVIFIIPVSFIGLFLTFYLFKLNFDQGGFAAFILLAALSVNANIYLLNEYNNIRRSKPLIKASRAYIKAWNVKIKPIFLTIASTVLGFIPFMVGEYKEAFWFPLAAGTVGGLIFSFIALFFFLPLFMGVGKRK